MREEKCGGETQGRERMGVHGEQPEGEEGKDGARGESRLRMGRNRIDLLPLRCWTLCDVLVFIEI